MSSHSTYSVEEVIDSGNDTLNGRRPTMEEAVSLPQRFLPSRGGTRPETEMSSTLRETSTSMITNFDSGVVPPVEGPEIGYTEIARCVTDYHDDSNGHKRSDGMEDKTSNKGQQNVKEDLETEVGETEDVEPGQENHKKSGKSGLLEILAKQMEQKSNPSTSSKITPDQAIALKLFGQPAKIADGTESPTTGAGPSGGEPSVSKDFATSVGVISKLKKWTTKTRAVTESLEKYPGHIQLVRDRGRQEKTELPLPLMILVKEEALPIVHNIAKAYKMAMGKNHKLTREAFSMYEELKGELLGDDVFL